MHGAIHMLNQTDYGILSKLQIGEFPRQRSSELMFPIMYFVWSYGS